MKTIPNKPFDNAGKVLLKLREKLELSQKELAAKLGTTAQTVSNCERGVAFLPNREVLQLQKLDVRGTDSYLQAYVTDKAETAQVKVNKLKKKAK